MCAPKLCPWGGWDRITAFLTILFGVWLEMCYCLFCHLRLKQYKSNSKNSSKQESRICRVRSCPRKVTLRHPPPPHTDDDTVLQHERWSGAKAPTEHNYGVLKWQTYIKRFDDEKWEPVIIRWLFTISFSFIYNLVFIHLQSRFHSLTLVFIYLQSRFHSFTISFSFINTLIFIYLQSRFHSFTISFSFINTLVFIYLPSRFHFQERF